MGSSKISPINKAIIYHLLGLVCKIRYWAAGGTTEAISPGAKIFERSKADERRQIVEEYSTYFEFLPRSFITFATPL